MTADDEKATTADSAADQETSVADAAKKRSAALHVDHVDARELGENAVTKGALERAEAKVGSTALPTAPKQPFKVWVQDGKAYRQPPEGGSTQLVGAEAEAYAKAHGIEGDEKAAAKPTAKKAARKAPKAARKGAQKRK